MSIDTEKDLKKARKLAIKEGLGKEVFRVVSVLCLIGCICALLLGITVNLTKIDPEEVVKKNLSKVYKEVYNKELQDFFELLEKEKIIEYKDTKGVNAEIKQIYALEKDQKEFKKEGKYIFSVRGYRAYSSYIEMFVLVEDGKIRKIQQTHSKETPGMGSKAFDKEHIDKYVNKEFPEGLYKSKSSSAKDEVVAVTGATKTSDAFNNAINAIVKYCRGER